MVTIGYSYPYIAKYDGSGGQDKYTGGMDFGEGVGYSDSIEVSESNDFYANNKISESDTGKFVSGEATITINGITPEAAKMVFGITETTEVETTTWLKYNDDTKSPELGYGHVKKTRENGQDKYWGFVLPRVALSIPSEKLETQQEKINWQTQEVKATILRSLNGKHDWKAVSETSFNTETEAYEAVKAFLSQNGGA